MSNKDEQSNSSEKRTNPSNSGSRENLYSKREQLLREMQGDDEARPISVREQVAALERQETATPPSEQEWGKSEKAGGKNQWMLWTIVGLALPVLALGVLLIIRSNNQNRVVPGSGMGLDFDRLSGSSQVQPEDWFVENSKNTFAEAVEILEAMSAPELTVAELAPLVRSEAQAQRIVDWKESGQWAEFDMSRPSNLTWEYGSSGSAGFMALLGTRSDYRDFRAYFVRSEDKLMLDVDATEAYCDVPVEKLPGRKLAEPVQMRVWVAKEPNFDSAADEGAISWYQILDSNLVDFVWAYAAANSELDKTLRDQLNYGDAIRERKREFRGVVTLAAAPAGYAADQFRLEELLATEWVLPNE